MGELTFADMVTLMTPPTLMTMMTMMTMTPMKIKARSGNLKESLSTIEPTPDDIATLQQITSPYPTTFGFDIPEGSNGSFSTSDNVPCIATNYVPDTARKSQKLRFATDPPVTTSSIITFNFLITLLIRSGIKLYLYKRQM